MIQRSIIAITYFALSTTLSAATCDDFWLERNAIFAKEGYCFKSEEGKIVFSNIDCKTKNPKLTTLQKQRVESLYEKEKKLHCVEYKTIPLKGYYQVRPNISKMALKTYSPSSINGKYEDFIHPKKYFNSYWLPSKASKRYFYINAEAKNIKALAIDDTKKWIKVAYNPGIGHSMKGWVEKRYLQKQIKIDKKYQTIQKLKEKALKKLASFETKQQDTLRYILSAIEGIYRNNRFSFMDIIYECEEREKNIYNCFLRINEQSVEDYNLPTNEFTGGESTIMILFKFEKNRDKVKIKDVVDISIYE